MLAGYVGLFTGCGALVALALFLPLPTRFGQISEITLAQAVEYSFYVVGAIAFVVAILVFFGLRGLSGEEGKGWRTLFRQRSQVRGGREDEVMAKRVRLPPYPADLAAILLTCH